MNYKLIALFAAIATSYATHITHVSENEAYRPGSCDPKGKCFSTAPTLSLRSLIACDVAVAEIARQCELKFGLIR
jgi:hypothetical protein